MQELTQVEQADNVVDKRVS